MRELAKKYSAEILILLSAITAILNTLMTHEGANAVVISVGDCCGSIQKWNYKICLRHGS